MLLQGLPSDVGAICSCYSLYNLLPLHPPFVWTFSSRQGLIREGGAQTQEESSRIGHKAVCVRGETEAIPSEDCKYAALHASMGAVYLTTKDMSNPHLVIIDHIGQMIRWKLVRFEQYRIGRQRQGGVPHVEEHQIGERR